MSPSDFMASFMQWLADKFAELGQVFFDAVKAAAFWSIKYIAEYFDGFMAFFFGLLSGIPGVEGSVAYLKPWVNAVNYWAPLDLFFILASFYIAVWPIAFIARVVIKVIRG